MYLMTCSRRLVGFAARKSQGYNSDLSIAYYVMGEVRAEGRGSYTSTWVRTLSQPTSTRAELIWPPGLQEARRIWGDLGQGMAATRQMRSTGETGGRGVVWKDTNTQTQQIMKMRKQREKRKESKVKNHISWSNSRSSLLPEPWDEQRSSSDWQPATVAKLS